MKVSKTIYWIATALICGIMLYSASLYFLNTEMIKGFFKSFGYPEYIVIPLAIAKVLGVGMILWRKSNWLTEWAYAGFAIDITLAFFAHYVAGQSLTLVLITMITLLASYFFGKEVRY